MLGFSDLLLAVELTTLGEGAYKLVFVHTCLVVGLQLQLGYVASRHNLNTDKG